MQQQGGSVPRAGCETICRGRVMPPRECPNTSLTQFQVAPQFYTRLYSTQLSPIPFGRVQPKPSCSSPTNARQWRITTVTCAASYKIQSWMPSPLTTPWARLWPWQQGCCPGAVFPAQAGICSKLLTASTLIAGPPRPCCHGLQRITTTFR